MEFYKNIIPLRDKIEAGADLVKTITSLIIGWCPSNFEQQGLGLFRRLGRFTIVA